jgi:hypothetical protein
MNPDSRRKGIVFFTTVILLSIVILVCAGMSFLLLRGTYSVNRIKYGSQAYALAQAGIEESIRDINNDFDYTPTGYPKTLGSGTYTVSIQNHPTVLSRKLVTSTGVVKGVSRSIGLQAYYTGPESFNYPALGGGKLTVAGGSVISNSGPITIHSNSAAALDAVAIGSNWPWSSGRVEGNANACGGIRVYSNGTVTGSTNPGSPYVELPPFDDTFFQYYYNLALADGKVYSGVKIFTSDPCAGTANHVVYVNGQVRLAGTWTMTGCIVATGKIIINKWVSGHITQHQWQNLPAFMSKNADVEIYDPTDIEGMVYANGYIEIDSIFGQYGPTTVYGSLYGKSWVNIKNKTDLHYRRPNPPGLPAGTSTVTILSWSERSPAD